MRFLPEHGDELRAPGGIVVVTAIATDTGGDGGVEDTVFCKYSKRIHNLINPNTIYLFPYEATKFRFHDIQHIC